MRKGGGKAKGGGWENEVGEKISLWLSHGQQKKLICRTVGSGAQFTTHAKKQINAGQAGDLMAQDPLAFPFFDKIVVEAKFWKNLEIIKFLERKGGKDTLYEALLKVQKEAEQLNKKWWLVAKQNNRKPILLMQSTAMPYMKEGPEWHWLFGGSAYMFYLDEFFTMIKPEWYLSIQQDGLPRRT